MNALVHFSLFFLLSVGGFSQQPAPAEVVNSLSRSADDELKNTIAELDRVRTEIAAEKLPLAESLTATERRVTELRKDSEAAQRALAEGNLDLPKLKAEIKAREDELAYVANILDEYSRTFEQKVNPAELQVLGDLCAAAKGATENTTLTRPEKFETQWKFVDQTLKRLFDAIGGMRFPGVAVDLSGAVNEGQYAMFGPVALFRAKNGSAGVVVPPTGAAKPLMRPLEGPIQEGIAQLVETGEGALPFDPSRGGALKAIVQKTSLIHIFEKGGPIMWPLLAASILSLATVLERVLFLLNEKRKKSMKSRDRLFSSLEHGDVAGAIARVRDSKDYVVRTVVYALEHKERSFSNALLLAQSRELKRFRRGISILDTVITLSPLLGLLGTVTGMMGSFSLIGGDLSAPGAITGGIAEALIATAFGLGIAIISVLPFNILNTKVDAVQQELDSAAKQVELLMQPLIESDETDKTAPHRLVAVGKE